MRAGRRDVPLSHPGKVLFGDDGITKADLAAYYRDVAGLMVPLVRDRPVSLQRFNNGIDHEGFFQKNVERGVPAWVRRVRVGKRGGSVSHVLANDAATLVWLANQNCITPHVWTARADRLERPDRMIFDLDPAGDGDFALVRRTARELGEILREAGVEPFAMTTGSKGIHVVVALRRRYGFDQVREAALAVATELVARRPRELTTEFYKRKRDGRLFVDVNRNAYAATAVPPYAVRARTGAPVATPLRWDELSDRRLSATRWTLRTVLDRDPDVWAALPRSAGGLPRL
ncbi:MAG TPA: non-homologous end-joining DNA ligase [Solirubrobacteraceae bacterium]